MQIQDWDRSPLTWVATTFLKFFATSLHPPHSSRRLSIIYHMSNDVDHVKHPIVRRCVGAYKATRVLNSEFAPTLAPHPR